MRGGGGGQRKQRPVGGGREVWRGRRSREIGGGVTTEGRGKSKRLLLRSVKRHKDSFGRDRYSGGPGSRVISLQQGGLRHRHGEGLTWETQASQTPGQGPAAASESS